MVSNPVPDHAMTCKMMWVIDEFTRESGAVLVVPSSHERLRHPNPDAHRATVPLEAPMGSVIVFSRNLIHGAGSLTIPGKHVGMTVYVKLMYVQPQEDLNAVVSDEVMARNSPQSAHLIGRDYPYPAKDFGFFNAKGMKYTARTADSRFNDRLGRTRALRIFTFYRHIPMIKCRKERDFTHGWYSRLGGNSGVRAYRY